jgi:hypothetical protein
LSYRGKSVDPTFGQPADGTSQAPHTIKVPSASTMRACRFGRIATIPSIRDNAIKLKAATAAQRKYVMTLRLPPHFLTPPDQAGLDPNPGEIEQIKQRALRRAEQLSNIYLDEADSADDQSSMELAQKLAAQSIMRLAGLRNIASVSALS